MVTEIHRPGAPTEPLRDQTAIETEGDGFEQKYVQRQNKRKPRGAESRVWSVDYM